MCSSDLVELGVVVGHDRAAHLVEVSAPLAAGDGIALLPASVAKALRRKDVVALPLEDGPESRIGLTWPRDGQHPLVDDFIGIVRGRTAHSSRNPEVAAREAADGRKASGRAPGGRPSSGRARPGSPKRPRRR